MIHAHLGTTAAYVAHIRQAGVTVGANVYMRIGGSTVLIASSTGGGAFSLSVSPGSAFGAQARAGSVTVTTETVTVTPAPAGTYSYSWALLSSDGGTWTIGSPTSSVTQFYCAGVAPDDFYNATFRCTATGSTGTVTIDVTASATNYGDLSHAFL